MELLHFSILQLFFCPFLFCRDKEKERGQENEGQKICVCGGGQTIQLKTKKENYCFFKMERKKQTQAHMYEDILLYKICIYTYLIYFIFIYQLYLYIISTSLYIIISLKLSV